MVSLIIHKDPRIPSLIFIDTTPSIITTAPPISVTTHPSLTPILLKIAIFGILANFNAIFGDEKLMLFKKPEDMLKSIVLAC